MKHLTDGELDILAELNADGPDCFDPYEREEYERWLDQLDAEGPADCFAASEVETPDDATIPF